MSCEKVLNSLKNNTSLWNRIYFIVLAMNIIWNLFILILTIAAFWKFSAHWYTYPPLFRWNNFELPMLLLLTTLLTIGGFYKTLFFLLMRILMITLVVSYWFWLKSSNHMSTLFESDIRAAWTEQMNGNPHAFNIIEDYLHCCGLNGTYDYKKINMTIPKSCEKYSDLNANGCLLAADEKFKLEQGDFFAWAHCLWIYIILDICFSLSLSMLLNLKTRQDVPLHSAKLTKAESPLLPESYYQNWMNLNCM